MWARRADRGQALIEALVIGPLVIALFTALFAGLALLGVRLQLIFVTGELATCSASLLTEIDCRNRARSQARHLLGLWGFQNAKAEAWIQSAGAILKTHASWGAWNFDWSFHEKPTLASP